MTNKKTWLIAVTLSISLYLLVKSLEHMIELDLFSHQITTFIKSYHITFILSPATLPIFFGLSILGLMPMNTFKDPWPTSFIIFFETAIIITNTMAYYFIIKGFSYLKKHIEKI